MFIEHRTYSLKPGALSQYFTAFGARGFELHEKMAPCLGWHYSEAGQLFQMVSLWRYDSFAQRLRRRAELYAMEEWRTLMASVQPFVNAVESRLVVPVRLWHGRGPSIGPVMPAGAKAPGDGATAALDPSSVPPDVPFIEHRIYTLRPGSTHRYLELYGAEGFAIHETHAPCVGFYATEAGALFQLVTMWEFSSFEERLERRAALNARRDWQERMAALSPMVDRIESKLLLPAPFWPADRAGRNAA
jgi:L-rhamnose mutarotase